MWVWQTLFIMDDTEWHNHNFIHYIVNFFFCASPYLLFLATTPPPHLIHVVIMSEGLCFSTPWPAAKDGIGSMKLTRNQKCFLERNCHIIIRSDFYSKSLIIFYTKYAVYHWLICYQHLVIRLAKSHVIKADHCFN